MRHSSIATKSRRCRTRRSGAQLFVCFTGIIAIRQSGTDSYRSGRADRRPISQSSLVCLFLLVRPIAGATAALISVLVPLTTPLYDPYAIEARPYALLCAFLVLALL